MKMKFINLTLILMLSIPSAQVLAIDSPTEAEEYINNSELDQLNANGTFTDTPQTVTYIYERSDAASVTVTYSDESGNELSPPDVLYGKIDGAFETEAKILAGWVVKTTPSNASGVFSDEPQIVAYVYERSDAAPVTVTYSDIANNYDAEYDLWGEVPWKYDADTQSITLLEGGEAGDVSAAPWRKYYPNVRIITVNEGNRKIVLKGSVRNLFEGCKKLERIENINNFDTSEVTNMSRMFYGNSSLSNIDVSEWNTSRVTDMSQLFYGTDSLSNIDVSEWNTSRVTDMTQLFYYTGLIGLDLSNFDTSVTQKMNMMFANNHLLKKLNISNFDTSKLNSASDMFFGTKVNSLTLGDKFHFQQSMGLQAPRDSDSGKWTRKDGRSASYTPTEFMELYGNTDELRAGEYVADDVPITDISNYSVSLENQVYSGFDQTPSITLKSPTGTLLTKSVDYELAFSNNLNVGTANITIKGIGTYAGEINKTFEITPATPIIEKLPSTTDLMANSALGESVISDGVVNGVGNDGKLTGQFKWKTPDHVVTESGEYTIVFTPTGVSEANYKPIETQVFVNVTKLSNVIPPVNIDNASPPIDLENTNNDRGTGLSIRYVSGLDFGQKELSFSEQKFSAKEDQAVNKDTGTSETFENMITVEDGRGIRNGWVLTVRQYSEFNDGSVLEMNPNVDGRNGQGVFTGSNKLTLNGLSQTVAWAKNSENQMSGITSIGFGEVTLTIPKGEGVGKKQNSLMWELIDGPVPP